MRARARVRRRRASVRPSRRWTRSHIVRSGVGVGDRGEAAAPCRDARARPAARPDASFPPSLLDRALSSPARAGAAPASSCRPACRRPRAPHAAPPPSPCGAATAAARPRSRARGTASWTSPTGRSSTPGPRRPRCRSRKRPRPALRSRPAAPRPSPPRATRAARAPCAGRASCATRRPTPPSTRARGRGGRCLRRAAGAPRSTNCATTSASSTSSPGPCFRGAAPRGGGARGCACGDCLGLESAAAGARALFPVPPRPP